MPDFDHKKKGMTGNFLSYLFWGQIIGSPMAL